MRAGTLRHRVTLEYKNIVKDGFGEEIPTWETLATVWAAVEPLIGREFVEKAQVESEVTTRIRIRRRADIRDHPEMRATWDGRVYDIQAVLEVKENRREILLMCRDLPNEESD